MNREEHWETVEYKGKPQPSCFSTRQMGLGGVGEGGRGGVSLMKHRALKRIPAEGTQKLSVIIVDKDWRGELWERLSDSDSHPPVVFYFTRDISYECLFSYCLLFQLKKIFFFPVIL